MKNTKRYCLESLRAYDPKSKMETWVMTKYCHDNATALEMFMTNGHRIWDTVNRREVKRNVDLSEW